MTSSERIGMALNSKNLKSDELHNDADIIAALGFANRLGSKLQRIRAGGEMDFYPAVIHLAATLRKACRNKRMGISNEAAFKCAEQGLREWLVHICRSCNGTGERLLDYSGIKPGKKRTLGTCTHCSGTGLFVPLWSWRKGVMRLDAEASDAWWEKRVDLAKEIAEDAYRSAQRKVTAQMREVSPATD